VRSDEAEAADAAGAEAMAEKLGGDDYVPPPVTPGAPPISPFAAPTQQQAGLTRALSSGKKGTANDDADLGKSLLDSSESGDLAGKEAATAGEGNMMQREMSAEIKRAAADGDLDVAEDLKAKKELPPLCAVYLPSEVMQNPAPTTSSPYIGANIVCVCYLTLTQPLP